ncbi:unnamed protein product [Prunus armeniaca]
MHEGIKSAAVNPNFGIRNRSNGRNLQDQHMLLLDVCGSSVRLSEDNGFERTSTQDQPHGSCSNPPAI